MIFLKPSDRDHPTENFQNCKFFQNSLNILHVYFWGDNVYVWGDDAYFEGDKVFSRGFSKILGFGDFLFVAGGGGGVGTLWVGGGPACRGFQKGVKQAAVDFETQSRRGQIFQSTSVMGEQDRNGMTKSSRAVTSKTDRKK